MGSVEDAVKYDDSDYFVVVTGFAPFGNRYPVNPSWEIAYALPPLIAIPKTSTTAARNIRVLVHPSPVKVSYETVRALVPALWTSVPRIDAMIHIGMASGRRFYSIERRGHRDGYKMGDVDGVLLGEDPPESGPNPTQSLLQPPSKPRITPWLQCPKDLLSDLNIDNVWQAWKTARPEDDVRISEDAGRYLCDFIYYESLARLWSKGEQKRVVFFHVPVDSDENSVLKGSDIAVELIRAVVQSEIARSKLSNSLV